MLVLGLGVLCVFGFSLKYEMFLLYMSLILTHLYVGGGKPVAAQASSRISPSLADIMGL